MKIEKKDRKVLEIKEEVRVRQDDYDIILEKGDRVRVIFNKIRNEKTLSRPSSGEYVLSFSGDVSKSTVRDIENEMSRMGAKREELPTFEPDDGYSDDQYLIVTKNRNLAQEIWDYIENVLGISVFDVSY